MRISVAVMLLLAACGSVGGQPDRPDGPASDAPRGGSDGPGTGSISDPLADYRSGTRIKMQVLTTPDGAKQFNGWFDTERNEACNFAQATDGVARCLPTAAVFSLFTDSSCSAPAAQLPAATAACTKYITASVTVTATCPGMIRYAAVIPAMVASPTPAVFVRNGSGSCVASTVPSGFAIVAAIGPEIPPGEFQSATLAVE